MHSQYRYLGLKGNSILNLVGRVSNFRWSPREIVSGADPCPPAGAKCPPNLGKMPPFAPKCPMNLGKMPSICHQSASVSFRNGPKCTILIRGANFQNFLGEDPPNIHVVLKLRIFHSNANWVAQYARVMCPLISLPPPLAPIAVIQISVAI